MGSTIVKNPAERLAEFIESHGFRAWASEDGRLFAIDQVGVPAGDGEYVWIEETVELTPRVSIVKSWLGY